MSEKIDMSLDDIIKLDRKKKKGQTSRPGVVAKKGLKQFRGRVGTTPIKRKNAVKGGKGVSPLNRKQTQGAVKKRPLQKAGNILANNQRQMANRRQHMTPKNMTKGILRKRANLAIKQASLQQFQQQRRRRQNLLNQNRGQVLQSLQSRLGTPNNRRLNRNTGSMVADNIIQQQKTQRRWKARQQKQNNQNDGIMTVSVKNDHKSSDVQVLVADKKRLRLNRNSTGSLVKTVKVQPQKMNRVQANNNNSKPVLLVTSPNHTKVQLQNSSQGQISSQGRMRSKGRMRSQGQMAGQGQIRIQSQNDGVQNKGQNAFGGHGQMKRGGGRRGRRRGNQDRLQVNSSNLRSSGNYQNNRYQQSRQQSNHVTNIQAAVRNDGYTPQQHWQEMSSSNIALQQQLKNLKPTVHHDYVFDRTDFGRASTGMTLNDRFRSVTYNEVGGSSVPGQSRLVYM